MARHFDRLKYLIEYCESLSNMHLLIVMTVIFLSIKLENTFEI